MDETDVPIRRLYTAVRSVWFYDRIAGSVRNIFDHFVFAFCSCAVFVRNDVASETFARIATMADDGIYYDNLCYNFAGNICARNKLQFEHFASNL